MKATKLILPVIVGTAAGIIIIMLGELLIARMHPEFASAGEDPKAIADVLGRMPVSAFLLLLANYGLASLVGGIAATLILKSSSLPAIVTGALLTINAAINVATIKHPLWFAITNLFVFIPLAYAGYLTARKKPVKL